MAAKRILVVLTPEEMENIGTLKTQLEEAYQHLHYTSSRAASIDAAARLLKDHRSDMTDDDIDDSLLGIMAMVAESAGLVNRARAIIGSINQIEG